MSLKRSLCLITIQIHAQKNKVKVADLAATLGWRKQTQFAEEFERAAQLAEEAKQEF